MHGNILNVRSKMSNLNGKSIIIVALLIMTQIYQATDAAYTIDSRRTMTSCPSLVLANNWDIEKFFGTWTGIELIRHGNGTSNGTETFEDSCMSIRIVEVNELNEEMTYGKSIDPFNFQLAVRHLKIELIKAHGNSTQLLATFNNTNQMLWHGRSGDFVIQIIKFDGIKMMMMTVCDVSRDEIYTIAARKNGEGEKTLLDSNNFNRLILRARKLDVNSVFNLQFNCNATALSGGQFNSPAMLLNFVMVFAATAVLHIGASF